MYENLACHFQGLKKHLFMPRQNYVLYPPSYCISLDPISISRVIKSALAGNCINAKGKYSSLIIKACPIEDVDFEARGNAVAVERDVFFQGCLSLSICPLISLFTSLKWAFLLQRKW